MAMHFPDMVKKTGVFICKDENGNLCSVHDGEYPAHERDAIETTHEAIDAEFPDYKSRRDEAALRLAHKQKFVDHDVIRARKRKLMQAQRVVAGETTDIGLIEHEAGLRGLTVLAMAELVISKVNDAALDEREMERIADKLAL